MKKLLLVLGVPLLVALARGQDSPDGSSSFRGTSSAAEKIVGAALVDDTAYRRLAWLSDRIGCRVSGSQALNEAIAWATSELLGDGFLVRNEKVMIPRWVRGEESAELVSPVSRKLHMLGLGNSVGTPPEGITAPVVVVTSFDELEKLGEQVRGRIVLFNVPFTSYGETVAYRVQGPSKAARGGAVAMLVRSVTPVSLRSPHTGVTRYADGLPKIPAAAVTIEDAELLARMQARGESPRVRLRMEARMFPDVESANVVADFRGSEKPEEIVLVGGHLDSWDVGQGSMDDGGGCVASWEAVRLIKRLGLRPRRTLRVVLFTNEENGTRGAEGYRDAHKDELANHVLVLESDSGVTKPTGIGLSKTASPAARAALREILGALKGIGADKLGDDGGGADIGPMMSLGVLGGQLSVDESRYFDIHHTDADTFDKIDRTQLGLCVATIGVVAHAVADMPERLK